ncbi:MAG: hypothetical protein ACREO5_14465, partial [Candidatus Binatia bacterium]
IWGGAVNRSKIENFGWAAATALVVMFFAGSARAEFPPEGFVADPDNPSKAEKTTVERAGGTLIKTIRHYYFDCRKKKWVFVSRDLWRGEGNNEEYVPAGKWAKDNKFVPSDTGGGDLESNPYPPGATKDGDNPNQKYNPNNGDTYNYDPKTKKWTDSFTGHVVSTELCPCPPAETICRDKSDSGGGLNLGIGIGIGGSSGHHDSHSHHGDYNEGAHKDHDEKSEGHSDEGHSDKDKSDHETHEEKPPKSGGCGPH